MEPDPGLGTKTATCPICHSEVETAARAIDAKGIYIRVNFTADRYLAFRTLDRIV
jgi:hypothetical protein